MPARHSSKTGPKSIPKTVGSKTVKAHAIPKLSQTVTIAARAVKGENGKYRIAAHVREKS